MKKLLLSSMLASCAFFAAGPAAHAEDAFTEAQKAEIESMFESYIMNNGETLIKALEKHQIEMQQKQQEDAKKNILDNSAYLYESGSPSFGPEDADVTIVEFFDYNCGYCKKALEEIQTILDNDKKVRVVFKEMPILSPASREAAQWALAADKQGKYFEFHTALMEHAGGKNRGVYEKIAKDLGLDFDKLEKDKNSDEVIAKIDENLEMAQKLGVRGTPAFVIGEEFSPGYIQADQMKAIIKMSREKNG